MIHKDRTPEESADNVNETIRSPVAVIDLTLDEDEQYVQAVEKPSDVAKRLDAHIIKSEYIATDADTTPSQGDPAVTQVKADIIQSNTSVHFIDDDNRELGSEPFSKCSTMMDLFSYARAHFPFQMSRKERNVLHVNVNGGKPFSVVQGDKEHYDKLVKTIKEDGCWKVYAKLGGGDEEKQGCVVRVQLI